MFGQREREEMFIRQHQSLMARERESNVKESGNSIGR